MMPPRHPAQILLVDSREKWTQGGSEDAHLREYFDRHEIPYLIQKLDVGDYALPGGHLVVDRKQNLEEISKNLLNARDHTRFLKEVRRARDAGLQLVVLIEHGPAVKKMDDVKTWRSKWTGASGYSLFREMRRLELAYRVRWEFCSKRSTAKRIIELLTDNKTEY